MQPTGLTSPIVLPSALGPGEEGVHRAAQQWSLRLRAVSSSGDESLLEGGSSWGFWSSNKGKP